MRMNSMGIVPPLSSGLNGFYFNGGYVECSQYANRRFVLDGLPVFAARRDVVDSPAFHYANLTGAIFGNVDIDFAFIADA